MTDKHTPGPWSFDGPSDSRIVWAGVDRRVCFMTSDGPNLANARLIAAAPCMARDLQSAWAVLSIILDNGWVPAEHRQPVEQCRDNARRSLSKATGAA